MNGIKTWKIHSAVIKQLGLVIFNNGTAHFFYHRLGGKMDNLSALVRKITSSYLNLRLITY